jgi:hypothetical protein
MIEIVIAIAVLSIGILSMFMALDVSRRLSLVSERHATMTHIAQKEVERLEGIKYSQLAVTSAPSSSTDPTNPDYYVAAGSPPTLRWDRAGSSSEPLDVDAGAGTVAPQQSWSEGLLSGTVYDFVTWTTDPKCSPGCPSSSNYKRLTVAVTMAGGLQPTAVYLSSVVSDPQAAPTGGISNGSGGNPLANPATTCKDGSGNVVPCTSPINSGNPNTYFLHDWPSTSSGGPLVPSADHATHPTVGVVNGLLCTVSQLLAQILGNIAGCPTPDLMDTIAPPGSGTPGPPLYHYSTDQGGTGYPGGRLLQPTCSGLCSGSSGGGTGAASDCNNGSWTANLLNVQSHLWVSSPLTATMTLTGDGGISMFTQTLNGAQAVVSFCVEIYDVPPSGAPGSLADLLAWPPVALGGAGYVAQTDPVSGGNWPTSPAQVSFIFNFRGSGGSISIAAGHRLGVRIWAKVKLNTAIDLIYDNPSYPTQVQLNSQ